MRRGIYSLLMAVLLFGTSTLASAVDLMTVYHQAVANDPTFKAAHADWLAAQEGVGIVRGAILPHLDITGDVSRAHVEQETPGNASAADGKFYRSEASYGITLVQSIFNVGAWAALKDAKASAKAAEATYLAAAQELMLRTSRAYFAVLEAYDVLRFTKSERRAVGEQLAQTEQQFRVGLIPITGVEQARASYDGIVADEIVARNALSDRVEELQEITGQHNTEFSGLGDQLTLTPPDPQDIDQWVTTALHQNYGYLAARYAAQSAFENITAQSASRLPTLNATGGFNYDYKNNAVGNGSYERSKVGMIGLSADFPAFQGGAITAQTRQARAQYDAALATMEQAHRQVMSQTRQAYLGVLADITRIHANHQAVISRESALKATKAAYDVGTNTMVDVLEAQSDLFKQKEDYAQSQYDYITGSLVLKGQTSALGLQDLALINHWLVKEIDVQAAINESDKIPATSHHVKTHAMKKKAFTIQLNASPSKKAAQIFVTKYNLENKTSIVKRRNNKTLPYIVTYGHYDSLKAARAALAKLPAGLKHLKPWITR